MRNYKRKLRTNAPASEKAQKWNNNHPSDAGGFVKLAPKEALKRKRFMDEARRLLDDQLKGRRLYR